MIDQFLKAETYDRPDSSLRSDCPHPGWWEQFEAYNQQKKTVYIDICMRCGFSKWRIKDGSL